MAQYKLLVTHSQALCKYPVCPHNSFTHVAAANLVLLLHLFIRADNTRKIMPVTGRPTTKNLLPSIWIMYCIGKGSKQWQGGEMTHCFACVIGYKINARNKMCPMQTEILLWHITFTASSKKWMSLGDEDPRNVECWCWAFDKFPQFKSVCLWLMPKCGFNHKSQCVELFLSSNINIPL